jgi:drug/metabolite transporter (DMT)-like permease
MPLWMAVLSRLFLGTRLPPLAVAGLVLGFAGTAVLVRPTGLQHLDLAGVAIALTAALCWASGSLAMTRLALPSRLSVSTAIQMLAGGAFMIVVGVARGELTRVHPAQISLGSAAALAYLVIVGSLVGFSTYTWLLATTRTSLISTYAYVNPVVAVLLGWLFLNERLTAQTLAASSLIVVAVAMIVWARRTREPFSTEAPRGGPAPKDRMRAAPLRLREGPVRTAPCPPAPDP